VEEHDELSRFETRASQWYRWQSVARDFIQAANYLLDWHDLPLTDGDATDLTWTHHGPAPMMVLYAVAVENLLRAILVAQGVSPVSDGKLAGGFKHHRLAQHADAAGVVLTAEERDFLTRLGDMIEAGKYPIGTAPGKTPGAWHFSYRLT
jgi:hypothetical protein